MFDCESSCEQGHLVSIFSSAASNPEIVISVKTNRLDHMCLFGLEEYALTFVQ